MVNTYLSFVLSLHYNVAARRSWIFLQELHQTFKYLHEETIRVGITIISIMFIMQLQTSGF